MSFHDYVRDHLPSLTIAREPEIVDELAQHLNDIYKEARASGATHEQALTRAHAALPINREALARDIESASRALPGVIADGWRASAKETPIARSRGSLAADLARDARYALRMLAGAPAFTCVVFVTLALGIGANAIIFTAVDAILLRAPGIADPASLVSVYNASTTDARDRFSTVSYPDYVDVRDSQVFEDIAAFGFISLALDIGGQTEPLDGEVVTGNYFGVLGVPIVLGRAFLPGEDRSGAPIRVAVVSHTLWRDRLGADPSAIGRTITLNGHAYSVVGVAPPGFTGTRLGLAAAVWVPMALQPEVRPPSAGLRRALGGIDLLSQRAPRWFSMVARRKPGQDITHAMAGLDVVARRMQAAYPATTAPRAFNVVPFREGPGVRTSARPLLGLMFASVVLLLLIACANVASLLLARAISRRRETAVRMAIGAGRGRLVRQWLTESVLLAMVGGIGGVLLARWGASLLHAAGVPDAIDLSVNVRVLMFTFLVAAVSGVIFGVAPVLQTMHDDTITALRDEGGAVSTGARAARLRRVFVVFQIAVSLMLLIGAGLFLRTLRNASAVELGYQVGAVMVADINLDVRGYSQEAGRTVYSQILERLRTMRGVAAAGAARVTVLSGGARTVSVSLDGQPIREDHSNNLDVRVNVISEGYLPALGIPILRGRDFTSADGPSTPRVAIVSAALAARLWPGQDPIGKPVGDGGPLMATVVGVVPDTVYRSPIERQAPPFYYVPLSQNYEAGVGLHVRAVDGDPLVLLAGVRRAVREVDPRITVARPQRLSAVFAQSIADQRMMAWLIGLFGGIALLLAAVGVYGIVSHQAGQRRPEIGIRLALGARPASIFGLILGEGLRLVAVGAGLGLAGALVATRSIENQLFGVRPTDPLTFIGVCVLLALVAAIACLVPARQAMRVDPVTAMRGN